MVIAKKWLQNYNYLPDAFVVEGPKAGGHLGFSHDDLIKKKHNLQEIVGDVISVTKTIAYEHNREIPVIAAGGIVTGQQISDLINIGASAVQLGTSFIATKECDASSTFKHAFINAINSDIRLIESPVGLPGRAIENDFLLAAERGEKRPKTCKYHCIKSCNPKTTKYCIADALLSAFYGKFDAGFAFSGDNGHMIKSITSVKEVFQRLIREYNIK